jgi:hypothetical protein
MLALFVVSLLIAFFVVTSAVGLFVILHFLGVFDYIDDLIDNHKVALRRILCGVAICIIAIVAIPRLIDVFKPQSHDNSLTPTIVVRPSGHKTGKAIALSPGEAAEHKENLLRRNNPDYEKYTAAILTYTANTLNGDKEYTATYLLEHPERARALYETIRLMIQGSSVTIQSFQN